MNTPLGQLVTAAMIAAPILAHTVGFIRGFIITVSAAVVIVVLLAACVVAAAAWRMGDEE